MDAIRIGLAADPAAVPRWVRDLLEALAGGEPGRVEALVTVRRRDDLPAPSRALSLYERLDRRRSAQPGDALATTDVSDLVGALPRVDLAAGAATPPLDVVLALDDPHPDAVAAARAAGARVWAVRLGADASGLTLAHDMVARRAVYEIGVVELDEPGGGARLIARSASRLHPTSLHRNRAQASLRARRLVLRCLRDLRAGRLAAGSPAAAQTPARPPAGIALAGFVARAGAGAVAGRVRAALWRDQWLLAARRAPGPPAPLAGFAADRLLVPPADVFWADPCVVRRDGRSYVFFEEYVYATGRGHISVLELDDGGAASAPAVVLKTATHLSYPYLLEHAGETYMIPESADERVVRLYRAAGFPKRWEPVADLLTGVRLFDASVVRHDGRWWLFGTIGEPGERLDDELHVFFADRLEGPWQPHERNPVISDARVGRPAGRPFTAAGALIRPAQDCSGDYGRAVVFRRVDVLTPRDYGESTVSRIDPEWLRGNLGSHTYSSDGVWELVDARRYARKRRFG